MQRLPSLTPEIRNHCSRGVVAFCRRNHSPLRQRRFDSVADLVVATAAAGGPFSFAAAKNGIGRGPRCHYDCSRRNHPSSQQRRLESSAEPRCRYDCSRRNHSSSQQRRLESSAEPRYFKACCRRNHSPSRQRKLESDADLVAVTTTAGGTFFRCIDSQVLA